MSSLKNKDADLTNPNLYHCIDDDNKLDHVYDEIKHKEGYGKSFYITVGNILYNFRKEKNNMYVIITSPDN